MWPQGEGCQRQDLMLGGRAAGGSGRDVHYMSPDGAVYDAVPADSDLRLELGVVSLSFGFCFV